MPTNRRNFNLGVANGMLFIFSETLLDPTLVLVAFLSQLTASPVLLGLLLPLRDGAWSLPQLWVSGYLQNLPRKIDLYRKMSYIRITCWGVLALSINFVTNPTALLVAFFVVYSISSLASGLSGLPFLEVVGKTIPAERRGEFFAWRYGLGGLCAVGGSLFVRWLIDPAGPLAFPHNFGLLSALYFFVGSVSLLLFNRVEEPADVNPPLRANFASQFSRAIFYVRTNLSYRRFIIAQSTLLVAGMTTPFFAVYVQQALGGSKAMIGVYLAVTSITNLAANLFFGRISRRLDNRAVMHFAILAGLIMSASVLALALLAKPLHISPSLASAWLLPVFFLSAVRGTGTGIASNSLLLDVAPLEGRSVCLGFSNTFQGLVLLSTGLSGVIMGWVGFRALVGITLLANVLALLAVRGVYLQKEASQSLPATINIASR